MHVHHSLIHLISLVHVYKSWTSIIHLISLVHVYKSWTSIIHLISLVHVYKSWTSIIQWDVLDIQISYNMIDCPTHNWLKFKLCCICLQKQTYAVICSRWGRKNLNQMFVIFSYTYATKESVIRTLKRQGVVRPNFTWSKLSFFSWSKVSIMRSIKCLKSCQLIKTFINDLIKCQNLFVLFWQLIESSNNGILGF
jgi:hypothetical protein